jgi:4-hydroxythreonine-4-phosphate dehydrogenase
MGDPAGIGLEITLMAWRDRFEAAVPPFVVFADADALTARARSIGLDAPVVVMDTLQGAAGVFADRLPVCCVRLAAEAHPGRPDAANGAAIIAAIEAGAAAVINGEAAALVTNPIAKSVLYRAGFEHPGHTEFLAHLAERHQPGRRFQPVMMLVADELRVVPLTVHIPLAQVPKAITRAAILDAVRTIWKALRRDFVLPNPRIAVAGLNPHAGEAGTLGREEEEVIAPAIRELKSEGLSITGPYPADTLFHEGARKRYDVALCMFHDQALIPFKTLAFETGVNVTLGLPFVRTSPDHGTAFDIAGRGSASPKSLIASLKLAATLSARRAAAHEREVR